MKKNEFDFAGGYDFYRKMCCENDCSKNIEDCKADEKSMYLCWEIRKQKHLEEDRRTYLKEINTRSFLNILQSAVLLIILIGIVIGIIR